MKKLITLFLSSFFIIINSASAQPYVEWAWNYPKVGNTTAPHHISYTPVGTPLAVSGYYITSPVGNGDHGVFMHKLDSFGNILGGDTVSIYNYNNSAISDGGLAHTSAGKLHMAVNFTDSLLVDGVVMPFSKGNYALLTRYSLGGSKDWLNIYPNTTIHDVSTDPSDNLLVLLSFSSNLTFFGQNFIATDTSDLLAVKIDPAGTILYSKQLHGNVKGLKLKSAPSGNMYIYGSFVDTLYYDTYNYTDNGSGNSDYFVLKTNAGGSQIYFNKVYQSNTHFGQDMAINYQEKTVVTAISCWTNGCFGKFDSYTTTGLPIGNASFTSSSSYGGHRDLHDIAISDTAGFWCLSSDYNAGDYGNPYDDWVNLALTKLDINGNVLLRDTFSCTKGSDYNAKDMVAGISNDLYFVSQMSAYDTMVVQGYILINNSPDAAYMVAKVQPFFSTTSAPAIKKEKEFLTVFPNPAQNTFMLNYSVNTATTLQFTVHNLLGEIIQTSTKSVKSGTHTEKMDLSAHPKGIYFVEMSDGSKMQTRKIILE